MVVVKKKEVASLRGGDASESRRVPLTSTATVLIWCSPIQHVSFSTIFKSLISMTGLKRKVF